MPHTTPARVCKVSQRTFCASAPVTVGIMAAWATETVPHDRPALVLMAYLLALSVSLGSALTAVASSCHMAIANAFTAGMSVGRSMAPASPPKVKDRPRLQLVE